MDSGCKVTPRPKSVKEFFTTWYFWKPFLGILGGLLLGYIYYHMVECTTCSWSIDKEAYSSMFLGGLLGFFVTGSPCSRFGR